MTPTRDPAAVVTDAMRTACRRVGLDPGGAELIRWGENALFRLATAPVIVRIARTAAYLPSVRREVEVSRWLAAEGYPAAEVVGDIEQPVVVEDFPVTFWHVIEDGGREASYAELGGLMRDLHQLTPPESVGLERFDPFTRAELRIESAPAVTDDDRAFLRSRTAELRREVAALEFAGSPVPVHADVHLANVIVDRGGRPVLIDLEYFCHDNAEWDLMTVAATHDSFGWTTEDEYQQFARTYGRDLRDWDGFRTLRRVQEYLMTTWLIQNATHGEEVARECTRRIASLRGPDDAPRHWNAY